MIVKHNITTTKVISVAGFLLVLLPILIYYIVIYIFSINIPYADDYFGALVWLNGFNYADIYNKILLLFQQANEHRIFSYYLTVASQYLAFGNLNFKYIILFGNSAMIGLFYVLYRLKHNSQKSLLIFSPVVLLLFVPLHEISDWGIMTLNGIVQYFLAFTSLLLLNKKGKLSFAVAVALAAITTFSFGNGMIVFIAGLLLLLLSKPISQQKVMQWSVFMIICVSLYFVDYNNSVSPYSKFEIFNQPFNGILYLLTLFGNLFKDILYGHFYLYYFFGFVVVSYFFYLIIAKWDYHQKYPLALSYLVFLFLSGVAATFSRIGYGVSGATASRYLLLPTLFLAILYILTLNIFQKINGKVFLLIILTSMVLYGARLTANLNKLNQHKKILTDGLLSYYTNHDNMSYQIFDPVVIAGIIDKAIKDEIYVPPTISRLYPEIKIQNEIECILSSDNIMYSVDRKTDNESVIQITGWAILKEENTNEQQIVVVLKSLLNTYVFSTQVIIRKDVATYLKNKFPKIENVENCGYNFVLDKASFNISPQKYQVGLGIAKRGSLVALKFSNNFVNFQ